MQNEPRMIQTLANALAERGYDKLTPVQEAVTNPELEGADLLVSAQTGSDKPFARNLCSRFGRGY